MLNSIEDEIKLGPVFRIEDLASRTSLGELVSWISSGAVAIDEQALALPRYMNSHVGNREPEAFFARWHQDVVEELVTDRARQIYLDLGYTEGSIRLVP